MSLRLKFLFLIFGVLIIPFLAVILIGSINFYISGSQVSIRSLIRGAEFFERAVRDGIDKNDLGKNLPVFEGAWRIYITDDTGAFLYPAELADAGDTGTENFLKGIMDTRSGEVRNIQILPIGFTDGSSGSLIFIRAISTAPLRTNRYLNLLLPFCIFLFTTVMSFIILRSINRSLVSLESATRRIADGDLSFELKARGRDQIASLVHSFNAMKEKLKEEYARRSRFMMSISHDLKSPLASIEGYTAAIRDGYAETPEKLTKYLSIIEQKTGLLESRISTLINFINKETTGWRAELRSVPIKSFLLEFDRILQVEAGLNNLIYNSEISLPDDMHVSMDEDMVLRAFDNIGQNAIRYSKPGGKIGFYASRTESANAFQSSPIQSDLVRWNAVHCNAVHCNVVHCVEVRFENEGEMIQQKDLPNLFEPFYRGDQARSTPGSGLGLSIVKSVLSSHGWDINVTSSPAGLTVFTVTIRSGASAQ